MIAEIFLFVWGSLAFVTLVFYLMLGFRGPVGERRFGPFGFLDLSFVIPFVWLAFRHGFRFDWEPSFNYIACLSFVSFLLANVIAFCLWYQTRWTVRLPEYLQPSALGQMQSPLKRTGIRGLTLQGYLLIFLLANFPESNLGWWQIPILGHLLIQTLVVALPVFIVYRTWRFGGFEVLEPRDGDYAWDVFVSYKSEDANEVRLIVNQLLALGIRVWFAEYQIRFFARDKFQDAIDTAIRESRFAILFTNDRYTRSEYVKKEIVQILDPKVGKIERVIEVCLPREEKMRSLYGDHMPSVPSFEYADNPIELLEFLDTEFTLGIGTQRIDQSCRLLKCDGESKDRELFRGRYDGADFSIDHTGWHLVKKTTVTIGPSGREVSEPSREMEQINPSGLPTLKNDPKFGKPGANYQLPSFSRIVDGDFLIISIRMGLDPPRLSYFRRLAANRLQTETVEDLDDREVYEDGMDFALLRSARQAEECFGVHLLHHLERPHLAITCWSIADWQRRYSVVFPHPHSGRNVEFAISVRFPMQFTKCCEAVAVCDKFVQGIRWESINV